MHSQDTKRRPVGRLSKRWSVRSTEVPAAPRHGKDLDRPHDLLSPGFDVRRFQGRRRFDPSRLFGVRPGSFRQMIIHLYLFSSLFLKGAHYITPDKELHNQKAKNGSRATRLLHWLSPMYYTGDELSMNYFATAHLVQRQPNGLMCSSKYSSP